MITKEQFIQSLVREIDIIKHLAGKIDPSKLDYRPTPGQRSTLELLQFVGTMISTSITANMAGDEKKYEELSENKEAITLENFVLKMGEQAKFVQDTLGPVPDGEFKKEVTMWGNTAPLSMHILQVLKMAAAYKMQLFLYIKASGNSSIGTSDLWAGRDMAPMA